MGTPTCQVLASLEPFYVQSIVRMALRRLKKHSSSDEFNRETVILILPQGTHFTPTYPTDFVGLSRFIGYFGFIFTSFLAGVESEDKCFLISEVLFYCLWVMLSIR